MYDPEGRVQTTGCNVLGQYTSLTLNVSNGMCLILSSTRHLDMLKQGETPAVLVPRPFTSHELHASNGQFSSLRLGECKNYRTGRDPVIILPPANQKPLFILGMSIFRPC